MWRGSQLSYYWKMSMVSGLIGLNGGSFFFLKQSILFQNQYFVTKT